jgi:exosome complex RNA-binding protein Rrp42 (RNase PH superfamily)
MTDFFVRFDGRFLNDFRKLSLKRTCTNEEREYKLKVKQMIIE